MTQARYREVVRDNLLNGLKCDACVPGSEIQVLKHYPAGGQRIVTTSASGESIVATSVIGQSIVYTCTGTDSMVFSTSGGQTIVSSISGGPTIVSSVSGGQTNVSSVSGGQTIVSSTGLGQSMVSSTSQGQSLVSTTDGGQSIVSSTSGGQSIVSQTSGGQSIVSSTIRGQSIVSTTGGGQRFVSSTIVGQRFVSSTSPGQSIVSSTSLGQSIVSSTSPGQSVVSSTSRGQSVVSPTSRGQSIVSVTSGGHSIVSLTSGGQSIVSPTSGGQSIVSTTSGGHSIVSSTSGGQSIVSPTSGGQSIVSTTSPGQRFVSSTIAGQIFVSSTSPGQSIVSSTSGGQSILTSASRGQSILTSTSAGQSIVSSTSGGQSVLTSASKGQSVLTSTSGGQSILTSTSGGQSTVSSTSEGQSIPAVPTGEKIVDVPVGKQTPFTKKTDDIFTATLAGTTAFNSEEFFFHLSKSQADRIKNSLDSTGKNETKVQLRFWKINTKREEEQIRSGSFHVVVNFHVVDSGKMVFDIDKEQKKQEPVDITAYLHLNSRNRVRVAHIMKDAFHCACELVQKRTVDELVDVMTVASPQHTEDMIKEKFKGDDDCEVATTNIKASLICPIGRMRLVKPCRSKHCSHVQCIDAKTILSMCRNKPVWKCQICQEPAEWKDLYIDGLFVDILKTVPWDVVEVEFLSDGSWTHKKAASTHKDATDKDKENICDLLNDTIDKLDVIDLTETDDEGTPAKKTPLKTNSSLMNKINKAKNICAKLTSRIEVLSSSYQTDIEERTSSYGCHRNNRNHYRQPGPYERYKRNNSTNYVGQNSYRSSHYYQPSVNLYSWRNNNVTSTGSNPSYQQNSSSSGSFFGHVIRPFWR
ncbi:uncharacterized protein LOC123561565 [Mercenaria mercenaria]|uniref:uncharacterized protein LOC123561565 n=1 Tax=Mercenaria mercenaria TaxID=6596 RepID=UPI00234F7D71|nr:uncharacterized protein LOC123561565 [Mercenaria mercenaria]